MKKYFKKIITITRFKKESNRSSIIEKKGKKRKKNNIFDPYLSEYNQKVLRRYNKPVVKDPNQRKKIFDEVRESLNNKSSIKIKNGDMND
jgi:hypothetical protein